MNKRNPMTQRNPKKNKLEKDLEGKPKITLKQLKKTSVHTPTQEEYNILMQVYECGGWIWIGGDLPTLGNQWVMYGEKTCIRAQNKFLYEDEKYYREIMGCKVISIEKFYDKQKITPGNIAKIKNYFETLKA